MNFTLAPPDTAESFLFFLMVGIMFFVLAIVAVAFMYSWTMKDFGKNASKIAVFLFLSITAPFLAGQLHESINSSQASLAVQVSNFTISNDDPETAIIQFKTSIPVLAYLEATDVQSQEMMPVLPSDRFMKRTEHFFRVPKHNTAQEIVLVLDGKKYTMSSNPIIVK